MKQRLLAAMLCLVLLLSLLPISAAAASTTTIELSGDDPSVLQAAIDAKKSYASNITLTGNVTLTSPLDLTNMTKLKSINLNGYTITAKNCTALKLGDNYTTLEIQAKNGDSLGGIVATGDKTYAIEFSGTSSKKTLKFALQPIITGDIINKGAGTITVASGTFTGDIVNDGSGVIKFPAVGADYILKHTGELINNGDGTITVTYGKFSKESVSSFVSEPYYVSLGEDGYYSVSMWTPAEAIAKGYVASNESYTDGEVYNLFKYYKTVADATIETNSIYLLCDADLTGTETGGFKFIYGTTPANRTLGLRGNTFKGSIEDTQNRKVIANRYTYILGGSEAAPGTAILTKLTTAVNLRIQYYANVTVQDGSAAGIVVGNTCALTIDKGTYTGAIELSSSFETKPGGKLTINGGDYTGVTSIKVNKGAALTIYDGTFTGSTTITNNGAITIYGGKYAQNVGQWCAEGLFAEKGDDGYYTIKPIPDGDVTDADITDATQAGETEGTVSTSIKGKDLREKAAATASSVTTVTDKSNPESNNGLVEAAKDINVMTAETEESAIDTLVRAGKIKLVEDQSGGTKIVAADSSKADDHVTVSVIKEPYLEVETKSLTIKDDVKEMELDITPKYNLLATVTIGEGEPEAPVAVSKGNALTVTEPTVIKVQLPAGFVTDTTTPLYVKHTKSDGNSYVYEATVTEDGGVFYASFTNPNGFSVFLWTNNNPTVAQIGSNKYATLQSAVNAASDGDTITLQKDCTEQVSVSGKSLTIDKGIHTFNFDNVSVGRYCTKSATDTTLTVTYDHPDPVEETETSERSVSGSVKFSSIDIEAGSNGSASVDRRNASSGSTVALTVTPDSGYTVDTVTVTDSRGNTVELEVVTAGAKYKFTMPGSDVTVTVTFRAGGASSSADANPNTGALAGTYAMLIGAVSCAAIICLTLGIVRRRER